MKNKKKILLYGGKSTALIVQDMLNEIGEYPKYIFDEYLKYPDFQTKAKFSNKKKDLKLFIKDTTHFFICIGMMDGKLRNYISNILLKKKLKQISLLSKNAIIDKTSEYGGGSLFMPNVVIHKYTKIGKDCYFNVNAVVDHECKIGNGVHVMGSSYIAGRVEVDDFASIGANATILPDLKIGKNAIVGAGSVVTKNVKPNEIVFGNPAKFYKKNQKKYNLKIL
jgi:acetyltransferase EpsM